MNTGFVAFDRHDGRNWSSSAGRMMLRSRKWSGLGEVEVSVGPHWRRRHRWTNGQIAWNWSRCSSGHWSGWRRRSGRSGSSGRRDEGAQTREGNGLVGRHERLGLEGHFAEREMVLIFEREAHAFAVESAWNTGGVGFSEDSRVHSLSRIRYS